MGMPLLGNYILFIIRSSSYRMALIACCRATKMFGVVLMLALIAISGTYARSGCASFGHSCYGGLGKRADVENPNEEIAPSNLPENPGFAFTGERVQPAGTNIPIRPLRYSSRLTPEQYDQINRYIRGWIISYLKREEEMGQK